MNCSLPGSSVHETFQARILEWVAISFSRGSFQSRDWICGSCISCTAGRFFITGSPEKPYFGSEVCSICGCGTHTYGGLTVTAASQKRKGLKFHLYLCFHTPNSNVLVPGKIASRWQGSVVGQWGWVTGGEEGQGGCSPGSLVHVHLKVTQIHNFEKLCAVKQTHL